MFIGINSCCASCTSVSNNCCVQTKLEALSEKKYINCSSRKRQLLTICFTTYIWYWLHLKLYIRYKLHRHLILRTRITKFQKILKFPQFISDGNNIVHHLSKFIVYFTSDTNNCVNKKKDKKWSQRWNKTSAKMKDKNSKSTIAYQHNSSTTIQNYAMSTINDRLNSKG